MMLHDLCMERHASYTRLSIFARQGVFLEKLQKELKLIIGLQRRSHPVGF
ncbi:hypothetical protein MTBLM5_110051 [Magnetospirillum sp. LM-5]|nr:hypothetical protein MTBLM5_110051 [Magnetospirillum sp. LM-5]